MYYNIQFVPLSVLIICLMLLYVLYLDHDLYLWMVQL